VAGRVPAAVLDAAMDARAHLRSLDALYGRVFGEPGPAAEFIIHDETPIQT
jgi:adenylosuccinate lyase